jgi:hypothetical protein
MCQASDQMGVNILSATGKRAAHFRIALALSFISTAAWAGPPGQPSEGVLVNFGHYKNLGGVIDRSVPQAAGATPTPEANASVAQFNRLADHNVFTSLPQSSNVDGGPALYTVLERKPTARTQVRPVVYRPMQGTVAARRTAPSHKRFCTVTEVSRSASTQACR